MAAQDIDLRTAINAVSDVIQNRPRPLRVFDQIYMKAADMVIQSQIVADWASGKKLAFIGDGDAISVCVAYLCARKIIENGPSEIVVFDFDERMCDSIERFAEKEGIKSLKAELYNCIDAFPQVGEFDCYYTNPPWGASNDGESVKVFAQRGMEAVGFTGEGVIVIADDHELEWCQRVLAATQLHSLEAGFFVQRMMKQLHHYHLDDAPDLRSCNLFMKALPGNQPACKSAAISEPAQLERFYGKDKDLKVKYVRLNKRLDYGKAHDDEYELELLEGKK